MTNSAGHERRIADLLVNERVFSSSNTPRLREGLLEKKLEFRFRQQRLLDDFLGSGHTLSLMPSPRPKLSIVVVTYNNAELTFGCLASVQKHIRAPMELIVVDNGSGDDTARLLDRCRGLRILKNEDNPGFLLAVRQAIAEACGEHILLLNNDASVREGSVESAVETLESDPSIGAVGGPLVMPDGKLQEAGKIVWRDGSTSPCGDGCDPADWEFRFRRDVDYCSGAFLVFRRSVWDQLGGFDDSFVPAYYEETDFCMRLREAGLRVVYEPRAIVDHFHYGSAVSAEWATALKRKNRVRFVEKHSAALQQQQVCSEHNILLARARPPRSGRVLYCDDRAPDQATGSIPERSSKTIRALVADGYFVSVLPWSRQWETAYQALPSEVEILEQRGRLEEVLTERKDYYDALVVSQPRNIERARSILAGNPDSLRRPRLIQDTEAAPACNVLTPGR